MSVVTPLSLRKMANSIASSYGDVGAIVISVGEQGTRIGVEGLDAHQIQEALCLAIHYNYCFTDDEAKPCPTSYD